MPIMGSVVGLAMIVVVNERTRVGMAEATRERRHTLEVQHVLDQLLVTLLDAETGQRGFLLTGDPSYRTPYERARTAAATTLTALRDLTADSPEQRERLGRLDGVLGDKLGELEQTITLSASGRSAEALELVRSDRGRRMMDEIRGVVGQALAFERERLATRDARVRTALLQAAIFTYTMLGVIVFILAVTIYLQVRLRRLEPLLTLCAWSKTVRLGDEWISFEEYLKRQFGVNVTHGISPKELAKFEIGPRAGRGTGGQDGA